MAYFKDADEVYETIGKLFAQIADDDGAGAEVPPARTRSSATQYSDPDSAITVRLQEGSRATSTSASPRWSPR